MRIINASLIAAVAVGLLTAGTTLVRAQDNTPPPKEGKKGRPTVEQRVDRLAKELNLTDDQKTKVKDLFEDSAKKMREIPREERRDKMPALLEAENKKMKEILKPDQWTKYQEIQKEMRQRRGGPGGPGAPGAPAAKKDATAQ